MSNDLYPEHVQKMMRQHSNLMLEIKDLRTLMDGKIFEGLVFRKKNLIRRQYEAMRQYAELLHERIDIERAQVAA